MPALNLIFRSGSNRVFGRACSLFLAVAIARCGGLSGQTSTNLPPPSPPPATQSTCATPAASNPVGGGRDLHADRDRSGSLWEARSFRAYGFWLQPGRPESPRRSAGSCDVAQYRPARVGAVGSRRSSAIRLQLRLSSAGASGRHHLHRRNNSHCSLQGRVSGSVGIQCGSLMRCDGPTGVSCCDEILPR